MAEKRASGPVQSTATQRLREALATMVRQQVGSASPPPLTASALCERAGISRNALYRYHPQIVQALHAARQKHRHRPDTAKRDAQRLRLDNATLREQVGKLAALVDHYFAAWQESRTLLQRRDRELADLRRGAETRVVSIGRRDS
jgi:hypothetical protein